MFCLKKHMFSGVSMLKVCTRRYSFAESSKRANFGEMVTYLSEKTPELLVSRIEDGKLHKNVVLRVLPHRLRYIPEIKGKSNYKAAWRGLQFAMTTFVLRQPCELKVRSVKFNEEKGDIKIRWSTDERFNTFQDERRNECDVGKSRCTKELWKHLGLRLDEKWLRSLKRHKVQSHIIWGSFIFKLDSNNREVVCHTIDEVELVEDEEQDAKGATGSVLSRRGFVASMGNGYRPAGFILHLLLYKAAPLLLQIQASF